MNNILDEIGIKNNGKLFSKLSLITALITMGLSSYFIFFVPKKIMVFENINQAPLLILGFAIRAFCLAGIIIMILSFIRKEPSNWFKWIGAILNTLLFLLIFGIIVFTTFA